MGRYWQRHPKKPGREVLDAFHLLGWRIKDPPKYFQVQCPCGEHMTHVHLSPSSPNHYQERLAWAKRQTCMKREEER